MGKHRGRQFRLSCVALCVPLVAASSTSLAQESGNQTGFMIRKQPQPMVEAIEDFERFRDRKAWEKAFAALAKVADGEADRLLTSADGLAIPASLKIRRELLTLPPDGREAYRLFNDAKAQQLFKQATTPSADPAEPGVDDLKLLHQVVDRYFITSIGDQAADRLGDALFEAGDFLAADATWQSILSDFPDSGLSPALLQAKRATALINGNDLTSAEQVRAIIHDRYAGQSIHLGGRDVDAGEYVDTLLTHRPTTAPADDLAAVDPTPLALPSSTTPAWQLPLLDADTAKAIEAQFANYGWGRMAGEILAAVPPVAVDDKRAYVNFFGACFAADLNTGKLLWQTVSPASVVKSLSTNNNGPQNMMQPTGFAITVAGNRVLVVAKPPPTDNNMNRGMTVVNGRVVSPGANLFCVSADAGKQQWSTADGPLSSYAFVGPPLVVGDGVYVVAMEDQRRDYVLLGLSLVDGAERSRVTLGTPQFPNDPYRGQQLTRAPALLARAGKIYVLTNDGAVLEVDPAAGHVNWAFTYTPKNESDVNYYYNYAAPPPPISPGAMLLDGSTLYLKEFGVPELCALDLNGPKIQWRRPADDTSGLVGLSHGNLYLLGASVDAIDASTKAMRWSDPVSITTGNIKPILAGDHLYAFGSRGVHDVSLIEGEESGAPFRGADRGVAGGVLLHAGDRLISVSPASVTAYPLGSKAK